MMGVGDLKCWCCGADSDAANDADSELEPTCGCSVLSCDETDTCIECCKHEEHTG
jgi:hypothetical protein